MDDANPLQHFYMYHISDTVHFVNNPSAEQSLLLNKPGIPACESVKIFRILIPLVLILENNQLVCYLRDSNQFFQLIVRGID